MIEAPGRGRSTSSFMTWTATCVATTDKASAKAPRQWRVIASSAIAPSVSKRTISVLPRLLIKKFHSVA
jgi:hypothetical protein